MEKYLRFGAVVSLTIILWELLRFTVQRHFRIEYFRRESDSVIIKVNLMPWDKKGKKHFEEQGYTREFPKEV